MPVHPRPVPADGRAPLLQGANRTDQDCSRNAESQAVQPLPSRNRKAIDSLPDHPVGSADHSDCAGPLHLSQRPIGCARHSAPPHRRLARTSPPAAATNHAQCDDANRVDPMTRLPARLHRANRLASQHRHCRCTVADSKGCKWWTGLKAHRATQTIADRVAEQDGQPCHTADA
ncbi:hypothetical protein D3C84_832290 [compost metagenome]